MSSSIFAMPFRTYSGFVKATAVPFGCCCRLLPTFVRDSKKKNMHFFRICVRIPNQRKELYTLCTMHRVLLRIGHDSYVHSYAGVYTNMEYDLTDTLWLHDNYLGYVIIIAVGRWPMVVGRLYVIVGGWFFVHTSFRWDVSFWFAFFLRFGCHINNQDRNIMAIEIKKKKLLAQHQQSDYLFKWHV